MGTTNSLHNKESAVARFLKILQHGRTGFQDLNGQFNDPRQEVKIPSVPKG
jgi:hypothetical protein